MRKSLVLLLAGAALSVGLLLTPGGASGAAQTGLPTALPDTATASPNGGVGGCC